MTQRIRDLVERAVSTAAQAALAVVTAGQFGLLDLSSWTAVAVAAGTAALLSVLKSAVGFQVGDPGSASVDPAVTSGPDVR